MDLNLNVATIRYRAYKKQKNNTRLLKVSHVRILNNTVPLATSQINDFDLAFSKHQKWNTSFGYTCHKR